MLIQLFNFIYITISYGLLFSRNIHICYASHSSIEIVNQNGYKGIIIAFSPEISNESVDKVKNLIQKASNMLYNATGGRAYFSEVTLLVPNSWTADDTNFMSYSDADIIITNKESNAHSFTMQFAGCGEHALPIVLSKDLIESVDDKYGDTAKLLVHEWAHYRYGVFNEYGFPNDKIYPAFYSIPGSDKSDNRITACADGRDSFNNITQDKNGLSCEMSTNNETGLPINENCIPLPVVENNTMKSSLMYSQSLPEVTKFCGFVESDKTVHKHNVNSPNKQNILCDGKDTWSVIESHLDSEKSTSAKQGEVHFVVRKNPTDNRILIAVAKSDQMKQLQRNLWINFALIKFTKTDLPKPSYVGLITFNGDSVDFGGGSSSVKWKTAEKIDTDITFGDTARLIDFVNLLRKGNETFSTADPKIGGVFVILIGGIGIKPNQIEQIETVANELRSLNVKLKIIVYPIFNSLDDRKYASQLFKKAISITGGSIVYIREDKISLKSSVSNFAQLLNALESVKTDFATNLKHSYYLVEEKIFKNPKNKISMSINVDSTLKNQQLNIYFIQTKYDLGGSSVLNKNSIRLKDPVNNTDYELESTFIPNQGYGYIQGFTVNPNNIKEGHWELSAETAETTLSDESVIALAKFDYINSNDELPIVAKCWLSSEAEHNPSKPLLVYVQVNRAIYELIQEAVVEVELIYESGQTISKFELLDNGLGDPDITKGDGIYSQYIVDIRNQGYYQINATVKDRNGKVKVAKNFGSTSLPVKHTAKTCCGSKIESDSDQINTYFTRIVDCGTILITDNFETSNYPPNTIRDLQIESVDYFNRTVNLLWTSPGGDYTHNEVNKYDIKAFHGSESDPNLRNDIKTKFDSISSANVEIVRESISVAKRYGEQQRTQVKVISEAGGMYYMAIKSYDREGHASDVSNIVVAYIKSNVVKIQSTTAFAIDVSKAPVNGSGGSKTLIAGMQWWEFVAICVACVIFLIFIIIIGICFVGKRRRKNEEESTLEQAPQRRAPDPPRISPPLKDESIHIDGNGSLTHSVEKIPNIHTITNTNNNYNAGSQPSLRELNVNSLSPVQSWDAKDLLSHWGRVQEAKQRQETPPVMRIEDIESVSSNRSPSYASTEDENSGIYTNPGTWRYQDINDRPTYIPNSYPEPAFRSSLDPLRSNTPSDSTPRYSVIRKPTTTVSQV